MNPEYFSLTYPIGPSGHSRRYDDEDAGPPLAKLKAGGLLSDVSRDYQLFTYAPLILYGSIEHNPVQEWINKKGCGEVVHFVLLSQPILEIVAGDEGCIWNKLLWAVEKGHWDDLSRHIGSMGFLNRDKGVFERILCQEIPVRDVGLKAPKTAIVTDVPVFVFSGDNNRSCMVMLPAREATMELPRLIKTPPRTATVKLGKAMLADSTNPYAALGAAMALDTGDN